MKKLVLTLAVAVSTMCAFAREVNVSEKVLKAFNTEFTAAKEVEWSINKDFYKASFVYNGNYVYAFYNMEDELIAVTRNISPAGLPMNLQTSIKKNYSDYWVSDLFELNNEDGTAYYITLENADTKLVLRSQAGAAWGNYKKVNKS
ncbi:MAG: hypothetical protein IPM85_17145 [Chitinophagaceae bacterium]|nr:hypothetical protein [Chitinophagaceae bacterium]